MIKMWIEENYKADKADVYLISKEAGNVVERSPCAAALVNILTDSELEAVAKAAFEKGHHAKIRQEYNSAILKNFPSAAGRFVTIEEAFTDYWDEFNKEK